MTMAKDTPDRNACRLTHRQMEIALALCSGDSKQAIARKFTMSPGRLKLCLTEIYSKLGVQNQLELVLFTTYHRTSPTESANTTAKMGVATQRRFPGKPSDPGSSRVAYFKNASRNPALSAVRDFISLCFVSDAAIRSPR